jgi:hypothetical protein
LHDALARIVHRGWVVRSDSRSLLDQGRPRKALLRRCLLNADRGKNENKRGERHQNRVLSLATYHAADATRLSTWS